MVMTFAEIEACFPEGDGCTDTDKGLLCTAQWLHDYARNVESHALTALQKERDELLAVLKALVDRDFTYFCNDAIGITYDDVKKVREIIANAENKS